MDPAQDSTQSVNGSFTKTLLSEKSHDDDFIKLLNLAKATFDVKMASLCKLSNGNLQCLSAQGINIKYSNLQESLEELVISTGFYMCPDVSKDSLCNQKKQIKDNPEIKLFMSKVLENREEGAFILSLYDDRAREINEEIKKKFFMFCNVFEMYLVESNEAKHVLQRELAITTRKLEEEKVVDDAMLDSIGDGVIGINDSGQITFFNSRAELLLGWKESEVLGKFVIHVLKMTDAEDNEILPEKRPIRTALFSKKRIISKDLFYVRKDGTKFPVSVTATPVVVYNRVIGGIDVFRDITKEKEIDRMKTEFISLASHQLRTPLSAMKWFSELLLDGEAGELNPEQKNFVNNISESNERMIQLVNSLLNISRIESGRIIIDPSPTDLVNLVQEVIAELQPKINEKHHSVIVSTHENLPLVSIDKKLIRHVYMNLLTNAIKYTPDEGEIIIMISKKGEEIVSQISDNGYGIPEREHENVFKKFFRADNVVKIETDGTGLGLYLTKAIVESSGGKIWFAGAEDKGTTFWFTLPSKGVKPKKGEVVINS